MSDEGMPFVCSQPGCGMQFTNEDHLAVHMRKHDMSLALNLTHGSLSPLALFTDQTPTPTKFLKNCEELGLFQELSKNPFDDSFKKAMDEPMDHVENSLNLPNTDSADLDTPQPPIPRIVIGGDEMQENRKNQDKPKDLTVSSIVPKKRKKFLSQSMPTSTTSEDEEEAVIGSSTELNSSSTNNDCNVLIEVTSSEPVQSAKRLKLKKTESVIDEVTEPLYTAQAVSASGDVPMVGMDSVMEKDAGSVISSSDVTVTSVSVQSQPAVSTGPAMVQVLLQLPNGQVVPVQVPASNIATSQQNFQKPVQQGIQFVPSVSQTQTTMTYLNQNSPAVFLTGNTLVQTGQNVQTVSPSRIIQNSVPLTLKSPQNNNKQTGLQTVLNQSATHPTLQNALNQSGSQPALQPSVNQSATGNILAAAQSALRTILVANKQTGLQLVSPQNAGLQAVSPQQTGLQIVSPQQTGVQVVSQPNNMTQIIQNALASKTPQKVAIPSTQSYAKQRLKAAIQQQTTPSSSQKYFQAGEIKSEPLWSPGSASSSATVSSPETGVSSSLAMSADNMAADLSDNNDNDSKRSKFLERNRAAAARCRQKRKQWVQTLERKAEDLSSVNTKLCLEIKKLRGEVASLKTMMLAHKDCPVTLQQRSQGHIATDMLTNDDDLSDIAPINIDDVSDVQSVPEVPAGSNHHSIITTGNQSGSQHAHPVPVAIFSSLGQEKLMLEPISVITGANSLGLIPKIINLDQNSQNTTSGS